jgi:hypothetical protein
VGRGKTGQKIQTRREGERQKKEKATERHVPQPPTHPSSLALSLILSVFHTRTHAHTCTRAHRHTPAARTSEALSAPVSPTPPHHAEPTTPTTPTPPVAHHGPTHDLMKRGHLTPPHQCIHHARTIHATVYLARTNDGCNGALTIAAMVP